MLSKDILFDGFRPCVRVRAPSQAIVDSLWCMTQQDVYKIKLLLGITATYGCACVLLIDTSRTLMVDSQRLHYCVIGPP